MRNNLSRLALAAYLAVAAVTLAWGAYLRLHIPQAPIVDPDIRGYLAPALLALGGKGFIHLDGRSFPYPAFVFVVLKIFGDFRALAVIQHLLGIAAGAVILLAWEAILRLVPPGGIPRELSRFLGLIPAAIYLGSATAVHFEQEIRPEAIFPFLTIFTLLVSLIFTNVKNRRKPAICLGALNVFLAGLIYLLKPSFGLAAVFSTMPVWIALLRRRDPLLLAAAVLPALLLLFLPEHILKRNDQRAREFLPETLFSVHAALILDQLSHDLASNAQTPYPRATLQAAHDLLDADLQKAKTITSPKAFDSLGYNPDYIMYDSFCVEFGGKMGWDSADLVKFCRYYYRRTALQQPGAMMRKVLTQMQLFYCSKNPAYRLGQSMDVSDEYDRTPDLIRSKAELGTHYTPLQPYYAECESLAKAGASINQVKRFTEWTRLFAGHYMDLLLVALISPLLLISCAFRQHLFWLIACLWLAYSYNFGNCLTIAVVHSLEVTRYVRIQLIYTIFAQCLCLYFFLEAFTYGVRRLLVARS